MTSDDEGIVVGETSSIRVVRSVRSDGAVVDAVTLQISDNMSMTGYYVKKFVDVQGYRRAKMMRRLGYDVPIPNPFDGPRHDPNK